jgi:hypothetical protein
MNQFIPELAWRYGYEVTLGAMAVLCGALWWVSSGRAGCRKRGQTSLGKVFAVFCIAYAH